MVFAVSGSDGNRASASPASTQGRSGPPLFGEARYARNAVTLSG